MTLDTQGVLQFTFSNVNKVANRTGFPLLVKNTTSPVEWGVTIEAIKNNVTYFTKKFSGTGTIVIDTDLYDGAVLTVCDIAYVTVTIKNPSVITDVYTGVQSFSGVIVTNADLIGKLVSLPVLVFHSAVTPENIFKLTNLTTLTWYSSDITTWDDRFGLGGLVNLTSFTLSFSYKNTNTTHNINLIKKLPNLTFLGYNGAETPNSANVTNNFDFPFDPAFSYSITDYDLDCYGPPYHNMLTGIPINLKYLRNLRNFSFQTGTINPFDFTYPLIAGADNTTLQTIVTGGNCRVSAITFPTNIEKLTALTNIYIGWANRNGSNNSNQNQVLLDFYDMFYSKIYNETNNTLNGYTVSSVSTYMSGKPSGFIHPTFRNATLNSTNGLFDAIYQSKTNEIIATGFNLTAYF